MMERRGSLRPSATIIEVVMAVVILSVALPPLMVSFADASMQSVYPSNAAVASFLAIERMEEIVARRYRGTDGYQAVTEANFPAEGSVSGFPGFSRSVTVGYTRASLAPAASDEGYKKARVVVTWNGGASQIAIERAFADF
jgi:hypothetical protein